MANLENSVGARLIERTTRSVRVSSRGQEFLIYADAILGLAKQARRYFEDPPIDGTLRLGFVEDFAAGDLHRVLGLFKRNYPRFVIILKTGLGRNLRDDLERDLLDVVLSKRIPGRENGRFLFSEGLIWVGDERLLADGDGVLPLATYPAPGTTRALMLETLRDHDRRWTVRCGKRKHGRVDRGSGRRFCHLRISQEVLSEQDFTCSKTPGCPPLGSLEYVIDQRARPRDAAVDAFVALLAATVGAT